MAIQVERREQPKAVCAAFGRVFYGSSDKLYFSQVIEDVDQLGRCYQVNDPTADVLSDLLDNDGGVINLDGAIDIVTLIPFRTGVLAFTSNGVWYIYGTSSFFTATSYAVSKITDHGIKFPKSVVDVGSVALYMSDSGIAAIQANEFDNLSVEIITDATIRSHYLTTFDSARAESVTSCYEKKEKRVWWVNKETNKALVFDTVLGAFYPQEFHTTYPLLEPTDNQGQTKLVITANSTTQLHFTDLSDVAFQDDGEDITAYLESGNENLGKFSNKKGITNIVMHFQRTETQVDDDGSGGYTYDYPSSCLLSVISDNSTYGSYKTTPRQMYRLNRRGWVPDTLPAPLTDQADDVVITKDKVRASGHNFRFRLDTEAGKDCQLLGYSVEYNMKGRQ